MAKIQAIGVGQRISTDVQVAKQDPRAAGMVWGAVGKAAGQVADVASAFVEKSEVAEATDFSLGKSLEYQKGLGELERNLKTQYANNPDGYAKAYEEQAVRMRQEISDAAPNDRARQGFLRNTDAALLAKVTQGYAKEQTDKVYQYQKGFSDRASTLANMQYTSPDPIGAKLARDKEMLNIEEQVAGGLISRQQADSLIGDLDKQVEVGFLSGMQANNYGGIVDPNAPLADKEKALDAYLRGDEKGQSLLNDLDPKVKARFKEDAMRSFQRQDKQRAKEAEAALMRDLNGILTGSIDPTSPDGYNAVKEQFRGIASNNAIDPALKETMTKKLSKAITDTEIKKRLALGDDMEKISQGVTEVFDRVQKGLGTSMATEIGQRAAELKSELDIEFAKSPADFVTKYDPALSAMQGALLDPNPAKAAQAFQSFSARADVLFNERNTPEGQRTYLPTKVAGAYKAKFEMAMTTGNYEEANNIYSSLENMGGERAYGLMREVGMTEQQIAIGEVSDPTVRAQLLQLNNPEHRKITEDAFNDVAAREGIKSVDIANDLQDPYFESMKMAGYMGQQSSLNAQTVKQQVELLYKSNLTQNMSREEAAKAAWAVFKKDNTLVKTNQKYEIALPKSFTPTAIKRTEEMFSMLDNASDADIATNLNLPANVRADDIASNGLWTVDKSSGRISLLARRYGPNGTMETMAVMDASGKPISFSAQEMESKQWIVSPTKAQEFAAGIERVEGVEAGKARALEAIRNRFLKK